MFLTVMAMAVQLAAMAGQDGPIRTAPHIEPAPDVRAAPPAAAAATGDETAVRAQDCGQSVNRLPGETEQACQARFFRALWQRRVAAADADDNPWSVLDNAGLPPTAPGEGGYSRNRPASPEGGVPAWALADPAAWEASECGVMGDAACRRQARNRLAMARAGGAAGPDAAPPAPRRDCRTVMQRSEEGFGGSFSRVCGDDDAGSQLVLDRLHDNARRPVEPCDRPSALESQADWIARCRVLPAR